MAKNKNDKRYQNTERCLQRAIGEISEASMNVKRICRTAKISRSTFYRHYDNLNRALKDIQQMILVDFRSKRGGETQVFGIFYELLRFIYDNQVSFAAIEYRGLLREILDELKPFITKNWNSYRGDLNEQMFLACRGTLTEIIVYWFEKCDSNVDEIRRYSGVLLNFTEEFGHFAKFFDN